MKIDGLDTTRIPEEEREPKNYEYLEELMTKDGGGGGDTGELAARIAAEESARKSADSVLQLSIANEANARQGETTALSGRIGDLEENAYTTQGE